MPRKVSKARYFLTDGKKALHFAALFLGLVLLFASCTYAPWQPWRPKRSVKSNHLQKVGIE